MQPWILFLGIAGLRSGADGRVCFNSDGKPGNCPPGQNTCVELKYKDKCPNPTAKFRNFAGCAHACEIDKNLYDRVALEACHKPDLPNPFEEEDLRCCYSDNCNNNSRSPSVAPSSSVRRHCWQGEKKQTCDRGVNNCATVEVVATNEKGKRKQQSTLTGCMTNCKTDTAPGWKERIEKEKKKLKNWSKYTWTSEVSCCQTDFCNSASGHLAASAALIVVATIALFF